MPSDYEYRGLVAQAWDTLRGDTSRWPDRAFYRTLVQQRGGPVLDVGCGTGRLLLDYLGEGIDIDGVDNSPEMLAICREKAGQLGLDVELRLFEQEMDALALPRRYDTILIPSSSFQLLTDEHTAARALVAIRRQLRPGGVLVMSIMSKLWPGRGTPPQMEWTAWHKLAEKPWGEGDKFIRRWIRVRFDHERQLQDEENRYEVLRDNVVVHSEDHARAPSVRWYSQAQICAACQSAGFDPVSLTSGFTFEPASPEDTVFCVVATGPA